MALTAINTLPVSAGNHPDVIPDRIQDEAEELFGPEAESWLKTPNTLFAGQSPNQLIAAGEEDSVRNVLRRLRYGAFS